MKILKNSILILSVFLIPFNIAKAGDLRIQADEVRVYSEPSPTADVVTTLFKGDIVKASNKPTPGYQKVKVSTSTGDIIGYIKNSDLSNNQKPQILKKQPQRGTQKTVRGARGLSSKWSVFLLGGVNYQLQGSRTYTNPTDNSIYNISSLAGLSTQFGLGLQFPITSRFAGKVFFELKSISVNGSATYQATVVSTAVPSDINLKEQFMSFGGGAQYYFNPYWWAGAGLQVDKTNSGTLKAGGNAEITLTGSDLVLFFAAYINSGYEFELFKNIYLVPNLKIVSLFSRPLIFEFDGTLNLQYAF